MKTPAARPPDISEVIVPREAIRRRVDELAREITHAVGGQELTIIGILDGAIVFLADLIRRLPMPVHVMTIGARSYRGASTRPGPLEFDRHVCGDLAGRHVLIVDDILDTGATLAAVTDQLNAHAPASCRVCVLLRKLRPDRAAPKADFIGFDVPDVFVVGYGLDFDGRYRNLPHVAALKPPEQRP